MSLLSRIGSEVKAISHEIKALPFSAYGSFGSGGYSMQALDGLTNRGMNFHGSVPGTRYDYKSAAGILWQNPSAAACFVALTKAFAQARPLLEQRNPKTDEWEQVDNHDLVDLLNVPNKFYSGEKLFGVTLISMMTNGVGFWRTELNGLKQPGELWFEPPFGMGPTGLAPNWDSKEFIKDYSYFIDGSRYPEALPRQRVVMFRHGLHPGNPRLPWGPLQIATREIATLNNASNYTGALMRNSGRPSGILGLDGSGNVSFTPPTPKQAEDMKNKMEAQFGGDDAFRVFVSSLPWKWNSVGFNPAEMAIDKIQAWPQSIVCALLSTPAIVAGLPTGEQPTYENLSKSMEWWWNNTIIPLEDAFGEDIETQLFPAFGLDPHDFRIAWDRSKVPALQEDESAKHLMVREDYKAGVIDLAQAVAALGHEADEAMKGVRHPSATPKAAGETGEPGGVEEAERKGWSIKLFDPNQPRGDDGRWEGAFDTMHTWIGAPLPDKESKAFQDGKARAIEKLEPYIGSALLEAATTVLRMDGSEYDFQAGAGQNAKVRIPEEEDSPVALLRAHSRPVVVSVDDWNLFLLNKNIEQMHIVTEDMTYSLHKPRGWNESPQVVSAHIDVAYKQATERMKKRIEEQGLSFSRTELREARTMLVAERFGILFRRGARKGDAK